MRMYNDFLMKFAKDVQKAALKDGLLCPVSDCFNVLTGKQTFCSDRCRKRYARAGGYYNGGETTLRLSTKVSRELGKYLGRFKTNERPYDIESERMKTLESGRAKVLTLEEIRNLWECYPDLLSVLLGLRV